MVFDGPYEGCARKWLLAEMEESYHSGLYPMFDSGLDFVPLIPFDDHETITVGSEIDAVIRCVT